MPRRAPGGAAALFLVLFLGIPSASLAQRDAFLDAFVEFHSALAGTYGDEGTHVVSALARMSDSLDIWERSQRDAAAALEQRATATAGDRAVLYIEGQQLDAAIAAMQEAVAAEPARASLHLFLGRLHDAAGQRAAATAAYDAARRSDPSDPIAAYLGGFALSERTDLADDGATAEMQPLLATLLAAADRAGPRRAAIPDFPLVDDLSAPTRVFAPPSYADGFALVLKGRFREAIASFQASAARDPLVSDPAVSNDRMRRGVAALRARRGTAAVDELEAAVRDHPASSEARRILGVVYRAVGRIDESIAAFGTAVELAPGDERPRVALGSVLLEAGRLQEAERVLRETIARVPASGEARTALADVYERLDRGVESIALLEEAASLIVVAGKSHLYWRIAELAHGYRRDHARVIRVLRERVRLLSNEPHAHKDLGLAFYRAGREDEALLELLMAGLLGLEDAQMLTAIGQVHLNRNQLDRAEAALRRAVALDSSAIEARYAFARTLQRLGRTSEAAEELEAFDRLRKEAFEEQRRKFDEEAKK